MRNFIGWFLKKKEIFSKALLPSDDYPQRRRQGGRRQGS